MLLVLLLLLWLLFHYDRFEEDRLTDMHDRLYHYHSKSLNRRKVSPANRLFLFTYLQRLLPFSH